MPELPEVEVLVRHLQPLLRSKTIREIQVHRAKALRPTPVRTFRQTLRGARFADVRRRGKYLVFTLAPPGSGRSFEMIGHLGMTGRMYLLPRAEALPKHAAVVLSLGAENFVFEDTRYFGRLTLAGNVLDKLGPEPLSEAFTPGIFGLLLKRFRQPIKVKLLDQSLLAGLGNIYASEALFRAGISPRTAARRLRDVQVIKLCQAIREVLGEAIASGSTVPLNYGGVGKRDGLFYFGRAPGTPAYYEERLQVYDRANRPCPKCGARIKRFVQMARSTFYCPGCQRA